MTPLGLELNGELGLLQLGPEVGLEARIRVIHGGPSCRNRRIKRQISSVLQGKYYEFQNNKQGFERVKQVLPKGCKAIESTGVYHINLAKYLGKEYNVRIINPLILKDIRGKKSDKNDKKLAELVVWAVNLQHVSLRS